MAKLNIGANNLAAVNPALVAEWHPTKNRDLNPQELTAGSDVMVWWLGECGHEWQSVICNRSRSRLSRGCPERSKKSRLNRSLL